MSRETRGTAEPPLKLLVQALLRAHFQQGTQEVTRTQTRALRCSWLREKLLLWDALPDLTQPRVAPDGQGTCFLFCSSGS